MAQTDEFYHVHGIVTGKHGRVIRGARVIAWRKQIRDREELIAGETSERGAYSLRYKIPKTERVLIQIEARSEELESPLVSPVTPAKPDLLVDLHLEAPDGSEWTALVRSIRPLLEGLKLTDLAENSDHQDVSFLALELNKSTETIMQVLVSARLETAFGITGAAFYAFVRQHVPSGLPSPLFDASQNFTLIDALVHRIGSLIFSLPAQTQTQALTAAVALDLIGPQFTAQIPELVGALQAQRSTDLLNEPYFVGKATLSQLLDVAQLPLAKQQAFAQALATNTQSMRTFWRALGDGQHGITAAEASAIQRTLSVGAFVKNDVPLVQTLVQGFANGTYTALPDLAKLSVQDWIKLVEQAGPPPSIGGAGTASPAEVFGRVVYTRVTRAYPTAALSSRISTGTFVPQAQRAPLQRFFQNNNTLELIKDNIPAYLETAGEKAFAGIAKEDQPAVVANLRRFQRVLRVAPTVDGVETLLGLGINAATQIAMMGRQQFFVAATKAGITKPEANRMFDAAAHRYAGVVSLYTQFNRDAIGVWPAGIGDVADLDQPTQEAIQRDDSLATLFGSQDYCQTDDCTSILSPAAYLCDLLLWLRNHRQGAGTALDVLDTRRADIRHLLLNCPNSETPLPYIDLVNELLADAISPPADPASTINPPWKQTSDDATAEGLLAAPQYFNQGAYVTLFSANYPHTLPYSAGLDELRTYAQQLKLPLWQIRQALLPLHGANLALQAAVGAERFGMAPHEEDVITTPNLVPANVAWNTGNPPTDLAAISAFLQAASLTYESLLELLQVTWVQGGLNVTIQGINDLCDTSVQSLAPSPLDAGFLDRTHRFLLLWRETNYKMWELDLLLQAPAVANGTLDQTALIALLAFLQLADTTRLPVDAQLAFFANLDTTSHRDPGGTPTTSLYARIFLNPAVTAIAPDPDLAALPSGGPIADPVLSDHLPAIQAALSISAADAATLFGMTNNALTLANLSLIYRVSALATTSKLSIPDLINIARLLSPAAANSAAALLPTFASPTATLAFLTQAVAVRQPGFTVDALTYLLTPPLWTTTTQMTQAQITTALQAVQQAITTAAGVNVDGAVIAAVASNAHTPAVPALANDVTALILQTLQVPGAAQTLLAVLEAPSFVAPTGTITIGGTPAAGDTLTAVLTDNVGDTVTVNYPLTALDIGNVDQTAADFAQQINASPAVVGAQAFLACTVSGAIITLTALTPGAPGANVSCTNTTLPGGAGHVAITPATTTMSGVPTVTPATFPSQYLAIQLFDKVAVVVRTLRLVASELSWLLSNAAVYGGLDFSQLPVLGAQPPLNLAPVLTTLLLIKLARLFTAAPPAATIQTLYDVIGSVHSGTIINEAEAQAGLATITGWPLADIVDFGAALGVVFPGDYTNPSVYDAFRTLEAMATTATATGAQIVGWAAVPPDEPTAEAMAGSALGVVKAQYPNNDNWLAVAPSLMNPIRERRAAALQAYLIGQRDGAGDLIYGDTNGLFDYFLIDVQMTSCQVTTRVVQAYIAVQIFVERCLMNLEAHPPPGWPASPVVVDLAQDDTWDQWQWMKRYRIWEANREVFLFPENWLIESQRPDRTEIYQQLEQGVRQGQSTADYLQTVVLNYIDGLDGVAHLLVTGTCEDPSGFIYVVARTLADPPTFYLRSFVNGAWAGWTKIPLDIKAHQVVPALYRGRVCLFWLDVKAASEPNQPVPPPQASSTSPNQNVDRYVALAVNFSIFRNGSWAPTQAARGKLFDKPIFDSTSQAGDSKSIEALYTLKVQTQVVAPGMGATIFLDIFRLGSFDVNNLFNEPNDPLNYQITGIDDSVAVHLGRAVFDGRFSDLELRNLIVPIMYESIPTSPWYTVKLLAHAQSTYGPDAQPLLPLSAPDPNLSGEPGLEPQAGALAAFPSASENSVQIQPLTFTSVSALEQNVGPLLSAAPLPCRVIGPDSDLQFDPASYFFFQDNRRCYYVESDKSYWTGSWWSPTPPSYPDTVPFQVDYVFHRFYHPFTRLFWNQLAGGGFPLLYDRNLQINPDQVDPHGADVFSFQTGYQPVSPPVWWDHDDVTGKDREFLDFAYNASFAVYNWELFFHIPLYIAQLLSQNLQFEDALTWFQYIFNPTQQGSDPVPQRYWVPKPLNTLTSSQILAERINNLLVAVNQGDPNAINQITRWRNDPFNPYLLADQRPVAYMKRTVMSYLDNLIGWGDNLFSTDSREALSEATLLYVIASEILGPQPAAITPPQHADESFDQLEPSLDAFANAMVNIENVLGGSGGGSGGGGGIPAPQTFYFKIPPNETLLGYWTIVADRLNKLRHCQNIEGGALMLALFDAPIDPGLLVAAQAAGVDLSSVLSGLSVALPNYRFTALYTQALDFVNAVRAYGTSLQAALEKTDAGALSLLQQTIQQQLLSDGAQILDWQVTQAQSNIDAVNQTLALAQQKYNFNNGQSFANPAEITGTVLHAAAAVIKVIAAATQVVSGVVHIAPQVIAGVGGMGGTPIATISEGGDNAGKASHRAGLGLSNVADLIEIGAGLATTIGTWQHRKDNRTEAAAEASIQIAQANAQLQGAQLALQIAQQNQTLHQEQIDNIQKQIDFLNDKFTSDSLYDWMVGQLSATYFQSYQLAYRLCKQVEACYRFELGLPNNSFVQFGYWDSLHKGLLAGEALNHDLRRMQSSYLDQNQRRLEISRYFSLGLLDPTALQQLLVTGACDFDLPELIFDNDYPGHYNRHLLRVSITVVYPNPGKFDNVKATLTLMSNKVRTSTDVSSGYAEAPAGSDPRFAYTYAAVPQKIVLGNAQDDPGLFLTAIGSNISDQRYLPFENAGAISSWHLEMLEANNEIDLSTVGDIVLHLYYTALDGGDQVKQAAQQNNAANAPSTGLKVFSAQNDFGAPGPTVANPYPLSPWQAFFSPATGSDEAITLGISAAKFPPWTRGKTITVTSLTVLAISWNPGNFVLEPQPPLPNADVNMTPVAGVTEPNVCAATVTMPPNTPLGSWTFKLRRSTAPDFQSLKKSDIGDVLLIVNYQAN